MHKPVIINNPKSLQHLVRLQPGQNIQLCLDNSMYKNHRVQFSGDFVTINESSKNIDSNTYYCISQNEVVQSWAEYSSVFLGEVWIDSDSSSAKLIIVLESTSKIKSNFLTIINPYFADIRTTPGDILEVVLFDLDAKKNSWSWSFHSELNCEIELIGSADLVFTRNNISYEIPELPYAKIPRTNSSNDKFVVQHHMWFRFTKQLISLLERANGVHKLGELQFVSQSHDSDASDEIEFNFNIFSNLDKKFKMNVLQNILLPKLGDFQFDSNHKDYRMLDQKEAIIKNEVNIELINSSFLEEGCVTKPLNPSDYKHFNADKSNNTPYVIYDEESI
jgi:hypothetical protein